MAVTLGAAVPGGRISAPITSDPTGLTGWSGGVIDTSASSDVGEPGGWEGPDGILHFTARGPNAAVWHAFSTDGGATWSKLLPMGDFPDSPGNKQFGTLSNGWNWYVGNPVPGSRTELVFSISRDGFLFDESFVVRDEPITPIWPSEPYKTGTFSGYEYPAAYYDEAANTLYVAYSRTRDFMEITKIVGANLLPPPGDYDQNRSVNAADYDLWKSHYGETFGAGLAADGNGDGVVNAADYTVWRNNLGVTVAPPVMASGSAALALSAADEYSLSTILAAEPLDNSSSDAIGGSAAAAFPLSDESILAALSSQLNSVVGTGSARWSRHRTENRHAAREEALHQLLLNFADHRLERLQPEAEIELASHRAFSQSEDQASESQTKLPFDLGSQEDYLQHVFSAW